MSPTEENTTTQQGGLGPYDLSGKIAVVSGGSSGIGAAICQRLASEGAKVVVGYHLHRQNALEVVRGLAGPGHIALCLSVADTPGLKAASAQLAGEVGRCDILVNAAAVTRAIPHSDLEALTDEIFDDIMTVNVRGTFALIRALLPLLRLSRDGIVVNVSSTSAVTGQGSCIAYCASKGALNTLTVSLARALAPDVRVVGLAPAMVDTQFVRGRTREQLLHAAERSALRIAAQADDVALAVLGLIRFQRLATGTVITIDGGAHL